MAIPVTFTVFNNSSTSATITGFNFVDTAGIVHRATLTNFSVPGVFTGISTTTNAVIPPGGQLDFITHYTTATTTLGRYTGTITVSATTNVGPSSLTATNLVLISLNPVPDPNAVVITGGGGNTGGGGGGGGWDIIPILIGIGAIIAECFTPDTQVLMEDGSSKAIIDVELGDRVWNRNKTSVNTVKFIERAVDTFWKDLYAPGSNSKPFATTNHPLYINDKLSVLDPKDHYDNYPWLGEAEELTSYTLAKTSGQTVYNLWVDGDGTYQVNGYGTTSIISVGWLNQVTDYGYLSYEQTLSIFHECSNSGRYLRTGSYWVNKVVGQINIKPLSKLLGTILTSNDTLARKVFITAMKAVGLVANTYYALRKKNV
jgi:hypothetical protein